MLLSIKKAYYEMPQRVRSFTIRAVILFVAWLLLYHLLLKPIGFPDTQLTNLVEISTAKVLSLFYADVHTYGNAIYTGSTRIIGIADECNGLELIVLYIGFMLCVPTTVKRLLSFAVTGVIIICLLNVLRCVALGWMNMNHNAMMDFAHHYAFKLIIYGVVFYGWMLYSKKLNNTGHAI